MKYIISIFSIVLSTLLLNSCSKESEATLKVHLTDATLADYDAVYLDIQSIEVNQSSEFSQNGWSPVNMVQAGAYNLLQFSNGKDTLLANGNMPAKNIRMIRLILGPDNRVVVDGKDKTLSVPQSEDLYLAASVDISLLSGKSSEVWIDIDVARSLVRKPNGQFLLQPFIRAFLKENTGTISGTINPPDYYKTLLLKNLQDTLRTNTDAEGRFQFLGVPPGMWSLKGIPEEDSIETLVDSMEVSKGSIIQLGTINRNSEHE